MRGRGVGVVRWPLGRLAAAAVVALLAVVLAATATAGSRSDPATTTDAGTTTAPETTAPAGTTTDAGTTTATTTAAEPAPCVGAGPLAIIEPNQPLEATDLGLASASPAGREATAAAYPDDGSAFTAGTLRVGVAGCAGDSRAPGGTAVELSALSVLGSAVRADSLGGDLVPSRTDDGSDWHFRASVEGLRARDRVLTVPRDGTAAVGDWAVLRSGVRELVQGPLHWCAAALELQLIRTHGAFPAGTKLLIGYACADRPYAPEQHPAPPTRQQQGTRPHASKPAAGTKVRRPEHRHGHRARRHASRPLRVKPPLGLHGYVFPAAGPASYGDSYGAARSDVSGGWHHGDDIFAPLGTPVVAVATGTLNRVGWEPIGGWRLWVRDSLGNEFYYAHLSGYTRAALRSRRVKAGEVIGFIGNTGDAFTTPPHLHFEIHPRKLLHLRYDGAVDPTTYLDHWRRLERVRAPRPVHPSFPTGPVRAEAKDVFRELLVARHLTSRPVRRPTVRPFYPPPDRRLRPAIAREALSQRAAAVPRGGSGRLAALVAVLASLGLLAAWMLALTVYRRRRSSSPEAETPLADET